VAGDERDNAAGVELDVRWRQTRWQQNRTARSQQGTAVCLTLPDFGTGWSECGSPGSICQVNTGSIAMRIRQFSRVRARSSIANAVDGR